MTANNKVLKSLQAKVEESSSFGHSDDIHRNDGQDLESVPAALLEPTLIEG